RHRPTKRSEQLHAEVGDGGPVFVPAGLRVERVPNPAANEYRGDWQYLPAEQRAVAQHPLVLVEVHLGSRRRGVDVQIGEEIRERDAAAQAETGCVFVLTTVTAVAEGRHRVQGPGVEAHADVGGPLGVVPGDRLGLSL